VTTAVAPRREKERASVVSSTDIAFAGRGVDECGLFV
jgi:hypothetical protein